MSSNIPLTAKAAGQLLLSHTAAQTQGSPHTPPNTPTHCKLHPTIHPKNTSGFCSDSSSQYESTYCGSTTCSRHHRIKESVWRLLLKISKSRALTRAGTHTHTHPLMAGNKYRRTTPMQSTRNHEAEQQPTRPGSITVSQLNDRGGKNQTERSCDWDEKRKQISWR